MVIQEIDQIEAAHPQDKGNTNDKSDVGHIGTSHTVVMSDKEVVSSTGTDVELLSINDSQNDHIPADDEDSKMKDLNEKVPKYFIIDIL